MPKGPRGERRRLAAWSRRALSVRFASSRPSRLGRELSTSQIRLSGYWSVLNIGARLILLALVDPKSTGEEAG
jgi:hypothetical protein